MILGLVSIQRDRGRYLREWVVFHYLVGFKKFYIYLHKCSDNSEDVLKSLQNNIDITITLVDPKMDQPQLKCYQDAYDQHGLEVDWMAFLDGDEFLWPTSAKTMSEALQPYQNQPISALGVYWSCFGSSGHINEPEGLMIENYRHRAKDNYHNNRHIKSLVRGRLGESVQVGDPHIFSTPNGTVDENLRPITKGWTDYEPTYHHLRINHYVTQSRCYFDNVKSQFDLPDGAPRRDEAYWQEHDVNEVFDESMIKFVAPLKKLLASL